MPQSTNLADNQFEGLVPGLDPRQNTERAVLEGQNFIVVAKGPRSYFGNKLAAQQGIPDPENAATFRFGTGEIVLVSDSAVYFYDTSEQQFYPVVTYTSPVEIDPWSHAVVGNIDYLCRNGLGVLAYDPSTEEWSSVNTQLPGTEYMISESQGRLICQTSTVVGYSVIDDGTDFIDTDAGAGYQALSKVGGGKPVGVHAVDDGFLSFTDVGIMRSIAVDSLVPFFHVGLTARDDQSSFIPLNAFCATTTQPRQVILLSVTGLYQYNPQAATFQAYQPLMSEALRQDILPQLFENSKGFIRIQYAPFRRFFTISYSRTGQQYYYDRAFVLYEPMEKFGSFDERHHTFGEFRFDIGPNEGYYFGFICDNGVMHYFVEDQIRETMPNDPLGTYHQPVGDLPWGGSYDGTTLVHTAIARMCMTTKSHAHYPDVLGLYTDVIVDVYDSPPLEPYDPDETPVSGSPNIMICKMRMNAFMNVIAAQPVAPPSGHQPSRIDVGLYRPTSGQFDDEASTVNGVSIATRNIVDTAGAVVEDWMVETGNEDWLTVTPDEFEDWNAGLIGEDDYVAQLFTANDGYNVSAGNYQMFDLEEIRRESSTIFYDATQTGIYHWVRLDAQNDNQKFQLKLLELTAIMAGTI